MASKSILIFGAGKIGRSFIGQLFGLAGYEVVFSDIDRKIVNALNERKSYAVVIKDKKEKTLLVPNVRAIWAADREKVVSEILHASILSLSVGKNALEKVIPVLGEGIKLRYELKPESPIDVIIAENMRSACVFLKEKLLNYLPYDFPFDNYIGLIETSIGKMVPIVPHKLVEEDPLRVFAESYNTLILDKEGFRNPIPRVEGLAPKEHIGAWVDRKLFIHNLGHAATAYWGYYYNPSIRYIWEALEMPGVLKKVNETMLQAAILLVKKYPGEFTLFQLKDHINDLLNRFRNKGLGDTIFRVGCDLNRKLSADDRLAGAIRLALTLNLPYDKILATLIVGCHFGAKDEDGLLYPSDDVFYNKYKNGIVEILKKVCGFQGRNYSHVLEEGVQIERRIFTQDVIVYQQKI